MRIVKYPHPVLFHESKPLRRVDAGLKKMIRQMLELMYFDNGIGLAANQVDLPYRMFVMNPTGDPAEKDQELVFINPVIAKRNGSEEGEEGCLSLPGIYAPVRRSARIVISGYNLAGEQVRYELTGLPARAAQHEYDHLDGVLFVDRLDETERLSVRKELDELRREFEDERSHGRIPGDEQIADQIKQLELQRT